MESNDGSAGLRRPKDPAFLYLLMHLLHLRRQRPSHANTGVRIPGGGKRPGCYWESGLSPFPALPFFLFEVPGEDQDKDGCEKNSQEYDSAAEDDPCVLQPIREAGDEGVDP
jgi:hypothetical protein